MKAHAINMNLSDYLEQHLANPIGLALHGLRLACAARLLPVLILFIALLGTGHAWDFTGEINDEAVTIIKYTGPGGEVSIPATIDGLPITSIGAYAFSSCTGLTAVTIPNSVTSIREGTFKGCSGLTAITVATGNPNFRSSDGVFFNRDQTTLIQYPAGRTGVYSIPKSVTNIRSDAFWDCTRLTAVTIPNSVASIGGSAFKDCTGLTSAIFEGNAPSMDSSAFSNTASGFTAYYIEGSVGFSSPIWWGYPAVGF